VNLYAEADNESDDSKDRIYEELESTIFQFLKYHMKILLGYFNKFRNRTYFRTNNWKSEFT
jgi:hypothetical protein